MTLHVIEDGNKFYVQTDPEAEEHIAAFNSEAEADAYVLMMLGNCKSHEDPEECDHGDHMESIEGGMAAGEFDGTYLKSFFCDNCNHFVQEEYTYEGIVVA